MRALAFAGLAILPAFAQTAETSRAFDAADVHVSSEAAKEPLPNIRGPFLGDGRYEIRMATMVDLISKAYGVDADKVFGGPSWIEYDRFDIRAKVPANTTPAAARGMLKALLADRFKLVAKAEDRPMPAYALKAGADKPKLKTADGSGGGNGPGGNNNGCTLSLEGTPAPGAAGGPPPSRMLVNNCRNLTMETFVQQYLRNGMGSQSLNNTPVVDQTGLEGAWDFTFKYTLPARILIGGLAAPPGATVTLFDALDKQLGLKLELTKLPLPVVAVESVNPTPTPNVAGIEKLVPAPPTEFEVADMKPVAPDFKGITMNFQPGRVTLAGPVHFLIQQAWNMRDEMVFGWEKWMDTDRYSIVGTVPISVSPAQRGEGLDQDTIFDMVKALLIERFKMKVHYEDRPLAAYTLVAAKPKLKKADPSERTKWVEGPGPDGKDPRNATPILGRLVTVTNMTMAQFAARLQGMASGYISSPVLDATGLDGAYDFTLSFSRNGFQNAEAGGRGGPDAAPSSPGEASAPEPNGGITLFEAMEKQLGLKLEKRTRPVQVLVIDHVEQKPVEN